MLWTASTTSACNQLLCAHLHNSSLIVTLGPHQTVTQPSRPIPPNPLGRRKVSHDVPWNAISPKHVPASISLHPQRLLHGLGSPRTVSPSAATAGQSPVSWDCTTGNWAELKTTLHNVSLTGCGLSLQTTDARSDGCSGRWSQFPGLHQSREGVSSRKIMSKSASKSRRQSWQPSNRCLNVSISPGSNCLPLSCVPANANLSLTLPLPPCWMRSGSSSVASQRGCWSSWWESSDVAEDSNCRDGKAFSSKTSKTPFPGGSEDQLQNTWNSSSQWRSFGQ